MKRIIRCLLGIMAFVLAVSIFDAVFMSTFAKEMNECLDAVDQAETIEEMAREAKELERIYNKRNFFLHRLAPTMRLEEIEVSLSKLKAFLAVKNYDECLALSAEIRRRVNQLYSTGFYRWYQSGAKRIG